LYVGGYFTSAGGVNINYIAQWNTTNSTWSSLGLGVDSQAQVLTLDSTRNILYVGGYFSTAGGISANYVAQWNVTNSTWSPLGME
jgi:hypothetical protein